VRVRIVATSAMSDADLVIDEIRRRRLARFGGK